MAPAARGPPALQGPRRRGDPPPLRRLQPVLRDGPRPLDDLHLRGLPDRGRDPRGGAVREVRPGRPQARPPARHAAARRRLRLGRDGPARRPALRRRGRRRHALARAGRVGAGRDQGRGPRRPGRGALRRLPRRARDRLRRDQLDRADRAHRREELPVVLRASSATSCGPEGRLLNHCITRPDNTIAPTPARSSTATSSPTAS